MIHHAGVIVGLLSRVHQVELGQVSRESLGAVYQHLLQACQILEHVTKKHYAQDSWKIFSKKSQSLKTDLETKRQLVDPCGESSDLAVGQDA